MTRIYAGLFSLYIHYLHFMVICSRGDRLKKKIILMLLIFTTIINGFNMTCRAASDKGVYVIPVRGEIGPAVSSFISEQLEAAKEINCEIVIFDIDTLGGKLKDILNIQETAKTYSEYFRIYTFIDNKAESAGAMMALLGEKIYMTPDATFGSAAVTPYNEKVNSAVSSILHAQAETMGRRGDIAEGMASYNLVIPGLKAKGQLLNLTADSARKLGYCDGIVKNINELISSTYRGKRVFYAEKGAKVILSEYLSNSYIAAFLLLVGIALLIIEAFVPSFGIAGTLGTISIVLYFMGNIFTGNTGWWSLILFILGIVFLIIEANIPGFGIPGIAGIISISTAVVMSARDTFSGLVLLTAFLFVAFATAYILYRYGGNSKLLSKIILRTEQRKEEGYSITVSSGLEGKTGLSLTHLRPSGIGIFDGKRYDIQTEGSFIKKNKKIQIIKIEGNKIFVKEREDNI